MNITVAYYKYLSISSLIRHLIYIFIYIYIYIYIYNIQILFFKDTFVELKRFAYVMLHVAT